MKPIFVSAAAIVTLPGPVFAQTYQDVELRLEALERANAELRAEVERLKRADAALGAPPTPAASAAANADGFKLGDATVKIGGFVKAEALISNYQDGDTATNALGRDFYLPSAIPVGQSSRAEDADFDAHAKQTRLSITVGRATGAVPLGLYLEADFQSSPGTQGTERTTNAYNFALRRAYATAGSWLFGQDWTTFQNTAALPETADFIGPTDGAVFVRQAQLRKTFALSKTAALQVSLENPETSLETEKDPSIRELDDDSIPDVVARLNWKPGKHELSIAAIGRELSVDGPTMIDPSLATTAPGNMVVIADSEVGWGVSAAGKIAIGAKNDLRFVITGGEGIGRYVGLNAAPDVMAMSRAGRGVMQAIPLTAGYVAYRQMWTAKARSTFSLSMLQVDNASAAPGSATDNVWSGFANLFYSPVKGFDLGVEYRHAERETVNGLDGALDRLHFVAKSAF